LNEVILRFVIGGLVVSAFSLISDLLKPKTFAELFGAAPSVALATLVLTVLKHGKATAAIEACSMIAGAAALFLYASAASYVILRFKVGALGTSLGFLALWFGSAVRFWYAFGLFA
jgi:hypothetical protein